MSPADETAKLHLALLARLRWAGLFEGATLVMLVLLAVPLKHLADEPRLVSLVGPLHGVAFLVYAWTLVQSIGAGLWAKRQAWRLAAGALLPFGAWLNDGLIRARLWALSPVQR
jgi:integral membrane protein